MQCLSTAIADVKLIEPRVFSDTRGYFFESYNQRVYEEMGIATTFVQDNESRSSYGVLRGLHCQVGGHAQAKLVRVLEGAVLDVAVDARPGSVTFGQHVAYALTAENKRQLFIPRGFLHGFVVLSDTCVFSYKCDQFYVASAEQSVRYDDAALGIDWRLPSTAIRVSEKDQRAGAFFDVMGNG